MKLEVNVIDAGHGDCILLKFGHTNILIDCGPKNFKIRNRVLTTIKSLLGTEGKIDIAIVTHNDDDHIGGFEFLIDDKVKVDKIIFNSLEDIPNIIKNRQLQISYTQDNELRKKLLTEREIEIASLTRESASIVHNDIKITAITPTLEILEKMHRDYISEEKRKENRKQKQISSSRTDEITIEEALAKIRSNQDIFEKDRSITNKSSIGIIIEYLGFKGLFLGDAHAEDAIEGLKGMGIENCKFDAVKISHHGSEKNTNAELLELIGKTEYILCADKMTKNNHPNNITLTRILNYDDKPSIHFSSNNRSLSDTMSKCRSLGFQIKDTYPSANVNKIYYEHK